MLLVITALAGLCLYDGFLHRGESVALMLLVIPLLVLVVKFKKSVPNPEAADSAEEIPDMPRAKALLRLALGLGVLLVSADITVWGAKSIAVYLGLSELIIGLTIVAIGTSLPELAASVMSALRGHHDIAIGNIFGSNLFNLMLVMTAAGAISPIPLSADVFSRDFAAMALMTTLMVALVAFAIYKTTKSDSQARLSRFVGIVLLASYGLYYVALWPSMSSI